MTKGLNSSSIVLKLMLLKELRHVFGRSIYTYLVPTHLDNYLAPLYFAGLSGHKNKLECAICTSLSSWLFMA